MKKLKISFLIVAVFCLTLTMTGCGNDPGSATVAVAINGVIRGVSKVQSIDTVEFDFQVMVAPESFQDGVNSIHFYQVNSNASTTDLSPILFESKSDVELINADNNSLFLNINSQRIPVVSNGDHGELTLVAEDVKGRRCFIGHMTAGSFKIKINKYSNNYFSLYEQS